jgi:hypothetical protein
MMILIRHEVDSGGPVQSVANLALDRFKWKQSCGTAAL